ncbi:MAG: hypothetical protein M1816_001724 [Peltula sp. TS41687]|nr:MAG: hypothetical protein M1816_001724 [Peltula sp. TS41687]
MESIHISTDDIKYQLGHFNEDRRQVVRAVDVTLAVLTTIAVISRLWARKITKVKLKEDDYTIIAALIVSYSLLIEEFIMTTHGGLGVHAIKAGISAVKLLLRMMYSYELLYALSIALIKTSIVLLFRRLFPTPRFKRAANIMLIFNIVCYITFTFTVIFQCNPIHYAWENPLSEKCINQVAFFIFAGVMGCVTDIAILIMPMFEIWKLQLSQRRKVALTIMFLLGGFVCVASIVRIPYVARVSYGSDPTWRMTPAGIWTNTEVYLGIVCACLPTLRPIFRTTISDPIAKLNDKRRQSRHSRSTGGTSSSAPSSHTKACSCQVAPSGDSVHTTTTRTTASSSTTLEKPMQGQCQCQHVADTEKELVPPPLGAQGTSSTNRKSRHILNYLRNHSPLRWPSLARAPPPSSMV